MGWIISITLLICYGLTPQSELLIASGIFAVAGSISDLAYKFKK